MSTDQPPTIGVGDRVRYYGRHMTGTVQSVWDVDGENQYVVTWVTGQTTTVPAGFLLPAPESRFGSAAQPWLVYGVATLVLLVGLAIPLIGWITLVPLAVWMMNSYANSRKAQR